MSQNFLKAVKFFQTDSLGYSFVISGVISMKLLRRLCNKLNALFQVKKSAKFSEHFPRFHNWLQSNFGSESITENWCQLNCSKFRNHFAKAGTFLPTVWLASYPGSGNTWLRYLIEATTGFFTRGPDPIVSLVPIVQSDCYGWSAGVSLQQFWFRVVLSR